MLFKKNRHRSFFIISMLLRFTSSKRRQLFKSGKSHIYKIKKEPGRPLSRFELLTLHFQLI